MATQARDHLTGGAIPVVGVGGETVAFALGDAETSATVGPFERDEVVRLALDAEARVAQGFGAVADAESALFFGGAPEFVALRAGEVLSIVWNGSAVNGTATVCT